MAQAAEPILVESSSAPASPAQAAPPKGQGDVHKSTLREHIIHSLEEATDETMVELIRVIEQKRRQSEAPLQPGEAGSGDMSMIEDSVRHDSVQSASGVTHGDSNGDVDDAMTSASGAGPTAPQESGGRARRIGISAAPVQMVNVKQFVPREIEKTAEEEVQVRAGIEASSLFAQMEIETMTIILKAMEKEEHPAGTDILVQDGPSNNKFYLITTGTCSVIKNGKPIVELEVGQSFGELEMMYEVTECAATVRTVTDVVFFTLDKETYQNIVLQVSVEKRELYMKLLQSVSFLEDVPEYEVMNIADALVPANYKNDEYIIRFGEQGQYLHFIVDGNVQIVGREMGKKKDIIQLGAGNVVGELEFLFNQATIADVIAITPVKTAKISRKHYEMCMGPIQDQLKTFIKKGKYDYFLSSASDAVKRDISEVEKRHQTKKTGASAKAGSSTLVELDDNGEIIVKGSMFHENHEKSMNPGNARKNAANREKEANTLYRFPLKRPNGGGQQVMMIVREDGSVMHWNSVMERLTEYSQDDVGGQPIFGFMASPNDQKNMQEAIRQAASWAGNVEGFYESEFVTKKPDRVYTFTTSNGLTKVSMVLDVIPSTIAQSGNKSESMLIIGYEHKKKVASQNAEVGPWFLDRIEEAMNQKEEKAMKQKLEEIKEKYSTIQAGESAENLEVINLQSLMGTAQLAVSAKAVERGHNLTQEVSVLLEHECYLDSAKMLEALKYALKNAVSHTWNSKIVLIAEHVEDDQFPYLQFKVRDSAGLMPDGFIKKLKDTKAENPSKAQKLCALLKSVGITMTASCKRKQYSETVFKVPYLPYIPDEVESEDENETMLSASTSNSNKSFAADKKKRTYTTLVFEDRPNHKNQLCGALWERKHHVVSGHKWSDVAKVIDSTDILIIDPQQSDAANLQQYVRDIAIVVTGDSFDEKQRKAYLSAGFFILKKPFAQIEIKTVLREAEKKAALNKAAAEEIEKTRETFKKAKKGEWKKGKLLGKGSFGEVYEAIDTLTKGKMAVKIINVTPKLDKAELINEINVMCDLQHKNIIHYFSCEELTEENKINVFMEFAEDGTLGGLMKEKGGLDMKDIVWAVRDMLDGIIYTHQQRFVHCDLKTENILLNNGVCKIGDFGTAKRLEEGEKMWVMQGTPLYMAPEVMSADKEEDVGYDFSADIWSLGVIVMEMATNKPPFSHIDQCKGGGMGLMRYISELNDTPDLSPLFDKHPAIIEFVEACLNPDPTKRPTALELKEKFSLLKEGDDDMAAAMKALKKAQFWHTLSQFVAFQDEEELEAERKKKEEAAADKKRLKGGAGDFFDSDDEDEDNEDDFFADSDDEDDEEDEKESSAKDTRADSSTTGGDASTVSTQAANVGGGSSDNPIDAKDRKSTLTPGMSSIPSGSVNTEKSDLTLVPHPPSNGSPATRRQVSFGSDGGGGGGKGGNKLADIVSDLQKELLRLGMASEDSREKSGDSLSGSQSSPGSEEMLLKVVEELKKKSASSS